ncbi:MAG: hypothetical protein ACLPJH_06070 [Myxococcaceae bacterium]
MDAPVYRHADARATLLGLNFPVDFFVVVVASYLWLMVLRPLAFLLATASTHAAVALLNRGRPPQHWAHSLSFQLRRLLFAGELSAAARSRAPQFPFGPYRSGDASRSRR